MLARVGRPSSRLHQTCASKLREAAAHAFRGVSGLKTTNYFDSTRLRTRTHRAALNSRRCEAGSAQASLSAFVHDATECRWELYRWLSKGMRLYYGLLRREP